MNRRRLLVSGAGLAVRKRAELMGRLKPCFARTGTWQHAGKYVSALASELPARIGWSIAQHAGDRTPDRTQRLLNRASRDALAAMSEVRRLAAAGLEEAARRGRRRGRLVIAALDETGQEKQGEATAGVKRQYMGCAGRVASGISTVHVSLVREKTGHTLAGARQWIPREHIEDPVTSLVTGLPLDLEFRTRGQLAIDICAGARADGISFDFACGDEVYGGCTQLREFFEENGQAYVLRVASSFMIIFAPGTKATCAEAVKRLVKDSRRWEVRSAGKGSKGERWYASVLVSFKDFGGGRDWGAMSGGELARHLPHRRRAQGRQRLLRRHLLLSSVRSKRSRTSGGRYRRVRRAVGAGWGLAQRRSRRRRPRSQSHRRRVRIRVRCDPARRRGG